MTIVGIIGGMGPMATVDLFQKIIERTEAEKDQEHIHLMIDNNTDIPDRSAHILGGGQDPRPEMKQAVKRLVDGGAQVLAMPCNTAHYYYSELNTYAKSLNPSVEFVHMIRETAESCYRQGHKKVLLLATEGTYQSHLYEGFFKEKAIELITPSLGQREIVMKAIYDYKSGHDVDRDLFVSVLQTGQREGVDGIILGCTELPLIAEGIDCAVPYIDPTEILATVLSKQ